MKQENINIAELLKDCPKGMELDCTVYNDVTFLRIDEVQNRCYFKTGPADTFWTTCEGRINGSPFGKCVIFPKGKTTWEGFQRPFEDGDIVATNNGSWIGIVVGGYENELIPTYCVIKDNAEFEAYFNNKRKWAFDRLATEEEKQQLFDAIKENGYKWNAETKTLEKLPKFKVGDRVRNKNYKDYIYDIYDIVDKGYIAKGIKTGSPIPILFGSNEDNYELVPNKFDITTLKHFDKVLVRQNTRGIWGIDFFGFYNEGYYYTTGNCIYAQCVPYEQNEHLLGKTDDCDDFYKTWE